MVKFPLTLLLYVYGVCAVIGAVASLVVPRSFVSVDPCFRFLISSRAPAAQSLACVATVMSVL